jgi:hypothetical protein
VSDEGGETLADWLVGAINSYRNLSGRNERSEVLDALALVVAVTLSKGELSRDKVLANSQLFHDELEHQLVLAAENIEAHDEDIDRRTEH